MMRARNCSRPSIRPRPCLTRGRLKALQALLIIRTISIIFRAAHAGVCLHELLEHFDFSRPAAEQSEAARQALTRYGFDESWLEAANGMLDAAPTSVQILFPNLFM